MRHEDFWNYQPLASTKRSTYRSKCAACNRSGLTVSISPEPKLVECDVCGAASLSFMGIVIYVESALLVSDSKSEMAQVLKHIMGNLGAEIQKILKRFALSSGFEEIVSSLHDRTLQRKVPVEDCLSFLKLGVSDFRFAEQPVSHMLVSMLDSLEHGHG